MSDKPLRFGLVSPILTNVPGQCSPWEIAAGPQELRRIAKVADELGFEYLTCSEHVGVPSEAVKLRGARFYDALSAFGFLAGITERIKFLTHIVVLPYHHPLTIAKKYGTLDTLSGGRVILGLGVGSLKEEFELLGATFGGRGKIYTEALKALRAALGKEQPKFSGEHFQFDDFVIEPRAVQQHMPLWLGGRTPKSLRRAVELAEGWVPFGLSTDELGAMINVAKSESRWGERADPFDFALAVTAPRDLDQPQALASMLKHVQASRSAGATVINLTVQAESASHYIEQLGRIQVQVMPKFA